MQKRSEILIVDDVSENIKVAINILKNQNYNFSYALSAKEAMEVLKTKRFDLILLDIIMPDMDGFTLCEKIKKIPSIKSTPVIFVTAKIEVEAIEKGFNLGAVDYVTKPFHPAELRVRVHNHLELYHYQQELRQSNDNLVNEIQEVKTQHFTDLEEAQKEIIYILSSILESDSGETACHVKRVANIARQLATLEGSLSQEDIDTIFLASPLHDIGKIFIDSNLLHKPSKLNPTEFEIIKKHPAHALHLLKHSKYNLIQAARIIAYQHHENFDGSGYPQGLQGEKIHIYGRIVAIADVLDALTHKRSYKEEWSFENAAQYILDHKGTKFDPRLVDLFLEHLEEFKEIVEVEECSQY